MTQLTSTRLLASSILAAAAALTSAQTTAKPASAPHRAAPTTATAAKPVAEVPCSKLPELSPKIPALPPGVPCAKPLYTITVEPSVKLDYVSPLEGPELRKTLGLESTSFSLDYIDTKIGTGELAAPGKHYTIHYTGYLTDGTKFDSSYDHPDHAPIDVAYGQHQVIPGWDTGFDGMRVGGKRRLFIPFQLAYGANGKPPVIPAKAELVFDVELISQSDQKLEPKAPAATTGAPATNSTPPDTTSPQPATSPNPNSK